MNVAGQQSQQQVATIKGDPLLLADAGHLTVGVASCTTND